MAIPHLRVIDPDDDAVAPPPTMASEAYTREERLALYREGVERLREMAQNGKDTAKSLAAAKLAAIFADSQTNQKGSQRLVVSFIDPRNLRDDPEDPLGIGLLQPPQEKILEGSRDLVLDSEGLPDFKV